MIVSHLRVRAAALALAVLLTGARAATAAATIVIINSDPAGVGFNDPTPAAPVGGNSGTTLGQQRLNAFQAAANIWGAHITSGVTIRVNATMEPLACNATGAVLGSAGAIQVFRFTSGSGPVLGTWYPKALANKLFGAELDASTFDIRARFNLNLGQPNCLTGRFFYLGLDNNHGTNVDLVAVLLHELGHGLGMQSFTAQNGELLGAPTAPFPSIFNRFTFDNTTGKFWHDMTNGERAASSVNPLNVVWTGNNVTSQAPVVLQAGVAQLKATAPFGLVDQYLVGTASFGAPLTPAGLSGEVMPLTGTGDQLLGCLPFSPINAQAVNNKVALIDRGVCAFTVKVANAQAAGARGVIIVDNSGVRPPPGLGGSNPAITIPVVQITTADGTKFKGALRFRSRTSSGVLVTIAIDTTLLNGADQFQRVFLYTPNPFIGGSSVSHWDSSAFANLLMEPSINGDLTHEVSSPFDLTLEALLDMGW